MKRVIEKRARTGCRDEISSRPLGIDQTRLALELTTCG